MIANKHELRRFLTSQAQVLRSYGVRQIGVFGSFARGDQTEASDIDFMVEFEPGRKTWANFMDLADFLESHAGRRIELLTPQALGDRVRDKILAQVEYVDLAA